MENSFKIAALILPNLLLPVIARNEAISSNELQVAHAKELENYTSQLKDIDIVLKISKDALLELLAISDKQIKIKADNDWNTLGLNSVKFIDELQQIWKNNIDQVTYWYDNIHWLQIRFPEAKYIDVVGLCKVADKMEYAVEQDYSMNAGRYVGVELEMDSLTNSQYKTKLTELKTLHESLCQETINIEKQISFELKKLINDK